MKILFSFAIIVQVLSFEHLCVRWYVFVTRTAIFLPTRRYFLLIVLSKQLVQINVIFYHWLVFPQF